MSNKKATKRALLTSITALAMCVVMLVGTTFAWFTDTATANVNKIQAGKLDVALEMNIGTKETPKWVTAEGKTLNFVKAAGGENQAILWEPGAEYKLPELRVVNNGNLNIKYKVEVTGIQMNRQPVAGVFDLNDVITWKADGLTLGAEATLNPTESKEFTISGKMDTAAGNDYQGLTINGVSITVYATQATGEYDSTRNDYDASAGYSVVVLPETANAAMSKDTTESKYEYEAADGTVKAEIPTNAVTATPEVTIKPVITNGKFVVDAGNGTEKVAYDISISNVAIAAGSTELAKVSFKLGAGLTNVALKHENLVMTSKSSEADLTAADTFYYDAATGMVTIAVDHFSVFSVTYAAPVATIGSTTYTSLADAFAAAKDGDTIMLLKNTNGNGIKVLPNTFANNGLTVDFNGYVYTVGGVLVGSATTGTNAFQLNQGNKITFKNGSIVGVAEGTKPAEDTPDWKGAPAIVLQNYCNLVLDNMIVTGGDETVYTMSNNCGDIVINNTTINAGKAQGYKDGPYAFDVYGGFQSYGNVTVKVDGNSVINGDIEVAHGDRAKNNNANTLILEDCTVNGNILKSDGTLNFAGNVTLNGNVNVTKNKDDAANRIAVTGATTLNLNGKIITPNDMGNNNTNFTALIVDTDTTINAGVNGGIDTQTNGGYAINVRNGATLTINGGTYYGGGTAVQVQKGTLVINDGTFEVEPYSNPTYGYKFLINCIDAAYKDGTAKIMVRGGSFVNYDPSDSASENPRGNFVDEGYSCTENNGVWTVTKKA